MGIKTRYAAITLLAVVVVLQMVQPEQTNPASDPAASFAAMAAPSPQTAAVVERACKDCHSNETDWPWYSKLFPTSWLVTRDVNEGRAHLNLSEWSRLGPEMSELRRKAMCEEARKGDMPLWQYKLIHPSANLNQADVAALCTSP